MNSAPMITAEFAKQTHAVHYPSLSAMLEQVNREPTREENKRRWNSTRADSRKGVQAQNWYGASSRAEAVRIIEAGWAEGAELVEKAYAELAPTLPRALSVRRKRRLAEQGDEIDVDALQRHDYAKLWIGYASQLRAGVSVIRIVVDVCGNFSETAVSLRRRGIAALCLSRILSKAGYSVEIVAAICGIKATQKGGKQRQAITVTLKAPNARPDVQQLAATVAFPGFFRTLGFQAIIHSADSQGADVQMNLGQAWAAEAAIAANPRMLQVVTPIFWNDEGIKVWLQQAIAMFQGSKR